MASLSISKAWEEARSLMGRNSSLFVPVSLALFVLPQMVAGVVAPPGTETGSAAAIVMLLTALLGLIGQLAVIRLSLGSAISVGEAITHGFRRFPMFLLSMILLLLLYALLMIPVVVAGAAMGVPIPEAGTPPSGGMALMILLIVIMVVALWPKFSLVPPVASEEKAGPLQIIRRSWTITRGHYGRLLGLMLLLIVLAVVLLLPAGLVGGLLGQLISPGLEPFSIGAFVAALIGSIAQAIFSVVVAVLLARIYVQLAGTAEPEVSVPNTND